MDIYKTIFPSRNKQSCFTETQCRRLLKYFIENKKTTLPQILNLKPKIANHTARISNLRRLLRPKGFDIKCYQEWVKIKDRREKHSEYEVIKLKK